MYKILRWEDWASVALGAWLVASPWALGFSDSNGATVSTFVLGITLLLLELMEAEGHEPAKDWIGMLAGLWLIVSPVALDFVSLRLPTVNALAVGLLAVVSAAWALSPLDALIVSWWHAQRHGPRVN